MSYALELYPWQHESWQRLLAYRACQGGWPHALLLTGSRGLGQMQLAQRIVQCLLCGEASGPCGHCEDCRWVAQQTHPDYQCLDQTSDHKALSIDAIRAMIDRLQQTPQRGRAHGVVIEPADALNSYAANALLKLLESPPGPAILILVTTQPQRVLPTLRSRCQQLTLTSCALDEAEHWCRTHWPDTCSTAEIVPLLTLAEGEPLTALAWAQQNVLTLHQHLLAVLMGNMDIVQGVAALKPWLESSLPLIFTLWLQLIADIVAFQQGVPMVLLPNAVSAAVLEPFAQRTAGRVQALCQYYRDLIQRQQCLHREVPLQPQLQLESALIRWQSVSLCNSSTHTVI